VTAVADPALFKKAADAVASKADVLFYTGDLAPRGHKQVVRALKGRSPKTDTLILALSTYGGSADAAYRIARCIAMNYPRFVIWILTLCKSAGTLTCLGANELVIWDSAELGPLDVQVRKPEELEEFGSGLDLVQALTFLEGRAVSAFLSALKRFTILACQRDFAGDMASAITRGMYSGIFSQIDPVRLGEVSRAMRIGQDYGERLAQRGKNVLTDGVARLVAKYPSHEFAIDRDEAAEIFRFVRPPNADENLVGESLAPTNHEAFQPPHGDMDGRTAGLQGCSGALGGICCEIGQPGAANPANPQGPVSGTGSAVGNTGAVTPPNPPVPGPPVQATTPTLLASS